MDRRPEADAATAQRAARRRLLLLLIPALLIVALGIAVVVLTDEDGDATPFVYTVF